jgi:hypothetical protein
MHAQQAPATIRLRPEVFADRAKIRTALGFRSAHALAEHIGVSSSTLRRAIVGESEPGSQLIAALMRGTGKTFDELCTVVDDS